MLQNKKRNNNCRGVQNVTFTENLPLKGQDHRIQLKKFFFLFFANIHLRKRFY